MKWADYVGYEFKAFGNKYKCVKYDHYGLHLELLDESADFPSKRVKGDIACISEMAVGRTYHPIYGSKPEDKPKHYQGGNDREEYAKAGPCNTCPCPTYYPCECGKCY